jgi:FixJ family two-component response regulator
MIAAGNRLKEEWIDLVSVKLHAECVTLEESHFLTTIGRDLRQPLQMLNRLQELLARKVKDKEVLNLMARLNEVENGLTDVMDTLLDLGRPETKIVCEDRAVELWQSTMQAEPQRTDTQIDANLTTIFMVGDESTVRESMLDLFQKKGWSVEAYPNGRAFIKSYRPGREGCLIIDARMPGMSGLEMLEYLKAWGGCLPTIMITGHADIRLAVRAMRAGAVGFLEKPVQCDELLANVERALELARNAAVLSSFRAEAVRRMAELTARERQVMELVVEGNPNKQIAYVLGINQRTVETHRATVMKKIGARSLPELIHLTIAGSPHDT